MKKLIAIIITFIFIFEGAGYCKPDETLRPPLKFDRGKGNLFEEMFKSGEPDVFKMEHYNEIVRYAESFSNLKRLFRGKPMYPINIILDSSQRENLADPEFLQNLDQNAARILGDKELMGLLDKIYEKTEETGHRHGLGGWNIINLGSFTAGLLLSEVFQESIRNVTRSAFGRKNIIEHEFGPAVAHQCENEHTRTALVYFLRSFNFENISRADDRSSKEPHNPYNRFSRIQYDATLDLYNCYAMECFINYMKFVPALFNILLKKGYQPVSIGGMLARTAYRLPELYDEYETRYNRDYHELFSTFHEAYPLSIYNPFKVSFFIENIIGTEGINTLKRDSESIQDRFMNYLINYRGIARNIKEFTEDIMLDDPEFGERLGATKDEKEKVVLRLLSDSAIRDHVEEFTPSAIYLLSFLKALKRIENWSSHEKDALVLTDLYQDRDLARLPLILPFYHPNTRQPCHLYYFLDPEKKEMEFRIYSYFYTGSALIGYARAKKGGSEIIIKGDVPLELRDIILFFIKHTGDPVLFNYETFFLEKSFIINRYAEYLSLEHINEIFNIYIENRNTRYPYKKVDIEHKGTGDRITVRLECYEEPILNYEEEPVTPEEIKAFWENKYTSGLVRETGKLPDIIKGLNLNLMLDIGGDRPSFFQTPGGIKTVSMDIGAEEGFSQEDNVLYIKGDAADIGAISKSAKSKIKKFTRLGYEENNWLSIFDGVVVSNLLNYVDAKAIASQLGRMLRKGAIVIVRNDINAGEERYFSEKGVKQNKDLFDFFEPEGFRVVAIYGGVKESASEPDKEMQVLKKKDAYSFNGPIYVVFEKLSINPVHINSVAASL